MFKVERIGTPPPPLTLRERRRYPWDDMDVGDSFFVPVRPGETELELQTSMGSNASHTGAKRGTKYRVIQETGGVRVWRVL